MARDQEKPGSPRFSDVVLRRIGPLKREAVGPVDPPWQDEALAPDEPVPAQQPGGVPIWQRPFRPVPNVRYTRTPDLALPDPHPPEAPDSAMAALIADSVRLPGPAPAESPTPRLDPATAPANVRFSRSPDLRTLRKNRDRHPAAAGDVTPDVGHDEALAADSGSGFDPGRANLPDHLYWETLDRLGEVPPEAAPSPRGAAPADTASAAPFNDNAPAIGIVLSEPVAAAVPDFPLHAPTMALLAARLASVRPPAFPDDDGGDVVEDEAPEEAAAPVARPAPIPVIAPATIRAAHKPRTMRPIAGYELPPVELLAEPKIPDGPSFTPEALEQNARLLEGILEDFGIRGEIIDVKPGPVVTLYELEPAAGIKSSRVIGLADDIARSMSALSARVAVIPGRNVIGIELPNVRRETVYFRELIGSEDFDQSKFRLALGLGKTIGGEPVIAQLEKMPHLLVAGTTGSGKSVAINTMILSLLYRLKPEECRLIMVDPKMLELSVYDGIPHLLCPVVTDPKKAVLALKWAVREMEERYKKMSKLAVRNIDGYNTRASLARASGEVVATQIETGFDKSTGKPIFEMQEMDLSAMPYIVIIVDEMADLMMVAGKEIEGAIQRLAQMARAAGIHLITATQRPSVDVITGTIKANFPTRISFQVTSKIDSRTILGEQGAEQLLGQGDMLHMAGGGRISRVHGPFVSDEEVEKVVRHLKAQGQPAYLDTITAEEEAAETGEDGAEADSAVFDKSAMGADDAAERDLYDQAMKVVLRDKKCSTSYIQRRLQIGYNKAASLVERMEKEGMVGAANHAGKREILVYSRDFAKGFQASREEEEEE